jgi:hypothetical protein
LSGSLRARIPFGVVTALLPFVALELALRIVFPLPEVLNFDRIHYSPLALTPNVARATSLGRASFAVASDPDGLEFIHRLNLYGFRDRDWPRRKPPGVTRVAFVGDSVVEGFMASGADTIPAGFERAARARGAPVDVLNLGVAAADFPEYLRLIRDSVPLFQPDLLVLVVYANDFRPAPYDPAWLAEPLEPLHASPWRLRLLHVARALRHGRRLPRRWTERPFPFFAAVPDPANPWSDPERARRYRVFVDPDIAEAMERGRFNPFAVDSLPVYEMLLLTPEDRAPHLQALRAFSERHGARLHVVYFPTRNQVSDRYRGAQRRFSREARAATFTGVRHQRQARQLRSACERLGIPFLDLTPQLREWENEKGPLFRKYDEHMTGEGYRLAGNIICSWWSDEAAKARGAGEATRTGQP